MLETDVAGDRSTEAIIHTLCDDVDRCNAAFIAAIDGTEIAGDGTRTVDMFHARQLFRAVFACIEAVTFSAKARGAYHCMVFGPEITDAERNLSVDLSYKLDDSGKVHTQPAHIGLAANIRFAIALTEKAHGVTRFDPGVETWWACLKSSIKVRDRLTHPKMPADLDISGAESVHLLKAYHGFMQFLTTYPRYPTPTEEDLRKASS